MNAKNIVQAGEENLVVNSVKSGRKIQQKKKRNVVIVQSGKNIVYLAGLVALPERACVTETLQGLSLYLNRRVLPRPRRACDLT